MTNTKNTKRALLASVLSLLLCISMLIGSTFAWFTDTATTGVNTIRSGNLDIALYEGVVTNGEISYDNEVTQETKLFDDEALWEPGYTEIAYLKLDNIGNLAVKYQFIVNVLNEVVGKNAEGGDIRLSEVLKYDLVEIDSTTVYADRGEALAAVQNAANLKTEIISGKMAEDDDAKYFALIVYMPETTGNEANYRGDAVPSIQLGVSVVATQDTVENDSFDNLYDILAPMPVLPEKVDLFLDFVTTNRTYQDYGSEETGLMAEIYYSEKYTPTFTPGTHVGLSVKTVSSTSGSITYLVKMNELDAEGNVIKENITANADRSLAVKFNIGKGLSVISVTHKPEGEEPVVFQQYDSITTALEDRYYYDAATGDFALMSKSFSTFEITYGVRNNIAIVDGQTLNSLESISAAAKPGDTVSLLVDLISGGTLTADGITFETAGHTVYSGMALKGDGNTLKDIEVGGTSKIIVGGSNNTIDGAKFNVSTTGSTYKPYMLELSTKEDTTDSLTTIKNSEFVWAGAFSNYYNIGAIYTHGLWGDLLIDNVKVVTPGVGLEVGQYSGSISSKCDLTIRNSLFDSPTLLIMPWQSATFDNVTIQSDTWQNRNESGSVDAATIIALTEQLVTQYGASLEDFWNMAYEQYVGGTVPSDLNAVKNAVVADSDFRNDFGSLLGIGGSGTPSLEPGKVTIELNAAKTYFNNCTFNGDILLKNSQHTYATGYIEINNCRHGDVELTAENIFDYIDFNFAGKWQIKGLKVNGVECSLDQVNK